MAKILFLMDDTTHILDDDFLEVLHNNYEADCFNTERLPKGVIGSYADSAEDFNSFHDWQNLLLYNFAKVDADVVLAKNFIFFVFQMNKNRNGFLINIRNFVRVLRL